MGKLVYIASPYTFGDLAVNVRRQIFNAEYIRDAGFVPEVPLLSHFWHMISPHNYEYWMQLDLDKLEHCDCLVRLSGESKGADREVEYAKKLGIPVYYSVLDMIKAERYEE